MLSVSVNGSPQLDSPSVEQSELAPDQSLSGGASGRITWSSKGLDGVIALEHRGTSMLCDDPSEAMGVSGEDGSVVGERAGEVGAESRPASSIAIASRMEDRNECPVIIESCRANWENSRPVRVYESCC